MAWEVFFLSSHSFPVMAASKSINLEVTDNTLSSERLTTFKEFNQISWEFSIMKIVWQIGSFSVCMTISLLSQKQDRVELI